MIKNTVGETKVWKAVSVFHRSAFFRPLRNSRGHKKAPPQDSLWVWYWAGELGLVFPTKSNVGHYRNFSMSPNKELYKILCSAAAGLKRRDVEGQMKKLTFTLRGTLLLLQHYRPGKCAPFSPDNYLLIAVLFSPPVLARPFPTSFTPC